MSVEDKSATRRKRVLLTVLGTNAREAEYRLGGKTAKAKLAPLALISLLGEKPDEVVALCTQEAGEESWPVLEQGAKELGLAARRVGVTKGETQQEIDDFLHEATGAIDGEVLLTVDLTHGFRHLSFLTFLGALYLSALRDVTVTSVYYGMLGPGPDPNPFLDVKALLAFPNWTYAVKAFRERGSALPMADLLRGEDQERKRIAEALTRLSESHAAGLPLELMSTANALRGELRKPFKKLLKESGLPLHDRLVASVHEALGRWLLDPAPSGEGWKGKVPLSEDLLRRQATLVDDLLARGIWPAAFGLMREWMVSWAALQLGAANEWLGHGIRVPAEKTLNMIQSLADGACVGVSLTDDQRNVAGFWKGLKDLRNSLSHHGMRKQIVMRGKSDFDKLSEPTVDAWEQTFRHCPRIDLAVVPPKRRVKALLASPIGSLPGVLFSAVRACAQNGGCGICLVVCSEQSRPYIGEALGRAEWKGEWHPLLFDDPFGGVKEIDRVVKEAAPHLVRAERVVVNVTGGTTLMGVAAERIARQAERFARTTRRFALIDRRGREEQAREPYAEGEVIWLDEEGGHDDDND